MHTWSKKWVQTFVSVVCVLQVLFCGLLFSSNMSLRVKEVTENFSTPLEDIGKIKFVFAPNVGDVELPSNQTLVLYSPVLGGKIQMIENGTYQVAVVGNTGIYAPFTGIAVTLDDDEKTIRCYHASGVYCDIQSVYISGVSASSWQHIMQGDMLALTTASVVTFQLFYADGTPILV